jgi:hypothetical protein
MTTLKDSVGAVITTTMIVGVISATRVSLVFPDYFPELPSKLSLSWFP